MVNERLHECTIAQTNVIFSLVGMIEIFRFAEIRTRPRTVHFLRYEYVMNS